ncbi:MAG: hypothetical protein REI45_01395, partial [Propionicimonas sp.]|nr:hypothetical protein [Propionicimonas sp.]
RRPGLAAATGAAAVLFSACAFSACAPAAPGADLGWDPVPLPGDAWPSSLAVTGDHLLVGGTTAGGGAPALLEVAADDATTALELRPEQGYAKLADLVWLSPADGAVIALGVARGGAHGNERWTTWDGEIDGPVSDHEQDFWTFGGHEAGPLLGVVRPGGDPVIVGSRGGDDGFHAALWTSRGTTWTRQPATDPQLRSGPDRVLSFRATAASGSTILIAGAEVGLAGAVLQSPTLWLGPLAGPWRTVHLPVPDELSAATGLALASAAVCGTAAGSPCWTAGWVRGRPVVWEVDPVAATAQATVLPGTGGAGTDPTLAIGLAGSVPVVATNADRPELAWRCAGSWRTAPAPATPVVTLASIGTRLYAVTGGEQGRRLWQAVLDTRGC